MIVTSFRGYYEFLRNPYPALVEFEGMQFPSAEHAYQAAKFSPHLRSNFVDGTWQSAKRAGRAILLPKDWETRKIVVMRTILESKFSWPPLAERLIATCEDILIEGNTWHDNVWGICECESCRQRFPNAQNMLGVLLMELRDKLARGA